jgi:xanthine dehydrogenase YagR molybdenum-binding subunit
MTDTLFPNTPRVDASEKVRGAAIFAADDARPGMLHAALAIAKIGKGRIVSLDTRAASVVPGVRLILTHEDLADLKSPGYIFAGGYGVQSFQPMLSPAIVYRGQPIALVAANTLEAAIEAANRIDATYAAEPFNVTFDVPPADVIAQADSPLPKPMFADRVVGDADKAFVQAPVKVDAVFTSPPQHHNPMELLATVAEWREGTLIIHEGTQNAASIRQGLAHELGLDPDRVQVISPYAGGGFGQKNSLQMQTLLAAVAARRLGKPVKLVVPRAQIFHDASFRPRSRHRIRLGADRTGRLVAAIHESDSQTSRHDLFPTLHTDTSGRLYGIPNFRGRERLVRTDVQTPGFMRGPWEHVACFAFESAVDEIAYALNQDPVALRLANDTSIDTFTQQPLSSRYVTECLRRGAERFGWSRRSMAPGSMRADDGSLIGWGVAIGAYPASVVAEIVRLKVFADGDVVINIGAHEMGQGIRNAIVAVVVQKLGVPADRVRAEIGDTRGVPQHVTAGSWGTASVVPAASAAADAMLKALNDLSPNAAAAGRTPAQILKAAGRSMLEVESRHKGPGQPDDIYDQLKAGQLAIDGPIYPGFVTFSYIAHFVEVRVESGTRRIRVPRVVSVVDCGRVVSPRTAESQVRGGVVWGIGAAMREASEVDPRYGGFINNDLAEYVVPVNADIGAIEVEFIDKPDPRLNSTGVKGVGEVVITGVAAAIANAIHHATGRRLRDLPIRIEHLL